MITLATLPHLSVASIENGFAVTSSRGFVTGDDVRHAARAIVGTDRGHRIGLFGRDGEVFSAVCLDCGGTVVADRKARTITGTALSVARCEAAVKRDDERAAKAAERDAAKAAKAAAKAEPSEPSAPVATAPAPEAAKKPRSAAQCKAALAMCRSALDRIDAGGKGDRDKALKAIATASANLAAAEAREAAAPLMLTVVANGAGKVVATPAAPGGKRKSRPLTATVVAEATTPEGQPAEVPF